MRYQLERNFIPLQLFTLWVFLPLSRVHLNYMKLASGMSIELRSPHFIDFSYPKISVT